MAETMIALSNREKQLIWRGLCDSEEYEKQRIARHSGGTTDSRDPKAQKAMVVKTQKRLKEIQALKQKWWGMIQ